ncbi:hypothetical protein QJS83_14595 [Bdellovibrio sp. 22V]|uniref:hypothetical protein n=1 Tax=Bdellovibrio TaxID=958 RepID=UPI002543DFF5|nr:hypothetical protein [Bdellovibrio sp. 22V]WII71695.1 hypothetical protein QJS83_14595 [Bdellovibrio sp. 22V]
MKTNIALFCAFAVTMSIALSSYAAPAISISSEDKVFFDESYEFLKAVYTLDKNNQFTSINGVELFKMPTNNIYTTDYVRVVPPVVSWAKEVKTNEESRHFDHCTGFDAHSLDGSGAFPAAEIARRFYSGFRTINGYYNSARLHKAYRVVQLADGRQAMATEVIEGALESHDRYKEKYINEQIKVFHEKGIAALDRADKYVPALITHTIIYRDLETAKVVGIEYFESSLERTHQLARVRANDAALLAQGQMPKALSAYARCMLPLTKTP